MSRNTKRTIIVAVSALIIGVTVFVFMVFGVVYQGEQLVKQLEINRNESSQENNYRNQISVRDATIAEREKLNSFFLEKGKGDIDFLNIVESLAREEGLNLETEDVGYKKVGEDETEWMEVQFSFSSSRPRVENFIKILETLPYFLRIDSVDLEARAANDWQAVVKMQVKVLSYD